MQEMQVGDIVFAPLRECGKQWPGKLQKLGVVVEIKFFRIKMPEKVPAKECHLFTPELAQQHLADNQDKLFTLAMKMAEKAYQSNSIKAAVVDLEAVQSNEARPALSMSRVAVLLPIKEEQDNCKQEQQEQKPPLGCFSSLQEYLMAVDIEPLITDSRRNYPRQYTYLSNTTKQPINYHKYPKFLLLSLLQPLLHLSTYDKTLKQRSQFQKKVIAILNSGVIGLQECMSTRVMKWIDFCLKGMKGREYDRTDKQFLNIVTEFQSSILKRFENYLDDYTHIAVLAKNLNLIYRATKS